MVSVHVDLLSLLRSLLRCLCVCVCVCRRLECVGSVGRLQQPVWRWDPDPDPELCPSRGRVVLGV